MNIARIAEQRRPAEVVIHMPSNELVALVLGAALEQDPTVCAGKCVRLALDYTGGACVLEVKIQQPAEAELKQE